MRMMKKRGELDAEGELQMEVVRSRFPWSDDVDFSECQLISHEDPCEEAFSKQACVREHDQMTLREVRECVETRAFYSCLQFQNFVNNRRKHKECEEELNVTRADADGAKCVMRCVMLKSGQLDKNGGLIMDAIKKRFRGVQEMDLGVCQSIKNDDECEEAQLKNACVMDSSMSSRLVQV